ncbi:MAG TPA: inositol monophosphatase family protein [Actinomycetota bacterium]|nr:inositol monophosphatase family protein [Actinomycetota bacterium]
MFDAELAFALEAADRAREISLPLFHRGPEVTLKADRSPVTEADLAIEDLFRKEVAEMFPADAVTGEEGGPAPGGHRRWIIDPIDGTKNFAAGIQVWGTLIALLADGKTVLGLVDAPALGERYEAVRGTGARLNGDPIRVSVTGSLHEATLAHPSLTEWPEESRPVLTAILGEARRAVGFGDFWGHCLVARGAADAMLEARLRIWDWAAVEVVVEEAGGRMTAFDGTPCTDGGSVLTSNGRLHDGLMARLR